MIGKAIPKYRNTIIGRINPFVRRVEFGGMDVTACSDRLVEDYARRNFVTAGGWALEAMAIDGSPTAQKSATPGVDAQRVDPLTGDYHLYALKSGTVTRNSDIIASIKQNGRKAEKLIRQNRSSGAVHLNYSVLTGKGESTFEDGVHRPSSAETWSQMFDLPQDQALELALAIAAEAGKLVRHDASVHINALRLLVATYLQTEEGSDQMDWEFIARRTMQPKSAWKDEDSERHKRALAALNASGYEPYSEGDEDAADPESEAD
ncbi:PmeII family type II restriction endonuclease [Streptomyces nigra]|uniref:PmeII family type II restriction endonuclease n=1 Tax=Streptomyces nigra TaxID=1827580 RepID=UPI0036310206